MKAWQWWTLVLALRDVLVGVGFLYLFGITPGLFSALMLVLALVEFGLAFSHLREVRSGKRWRGHPGAQEGNHG